MNQQIAANHPDAKWVFKPRANSCGRGIQVFASGRSLLEFVTTEKKTDGICQVYIERPLLVHNRKFDIRMYLLVARTSPFVAYYSRRGYARLCIGEYTDNFDDLTIHLTNQAVQKRLSATYKQTKEDTTWDFEHLEENLVSEGRVPAGWINERFLPKVEEIMQILSGIIKKQVQPFVGTYDLLGCDFFLDSKAGDY